MHPLQYTMLNEGKQTEHYTLNTEISSYIFQTARKSISVARLNAKHKLFVNDTLDMKQDTSQNAQTQGMTRQKQACVQR